MFYQIEFSFDLLSFDIKTPQITDFTNDDIKLGEVHGTYVICIVSDSYFPIWFFVLSHGGSNTAPSATIARMHNAKKIKIVVRAFQIRVERT